MMLPEQFKELESNLISLGYKKITTALYGQTKYSETYDYYIAKRDDKGKLLYQIFYRVWDYTDEADYIKEKMNGYLYGVEIAIMPSGNERSDLCYIPVNFTDIDSIKKYEYTAYDFYIFCLSHNLL